MEAHEIFKERVRARLSELQWTHEDLAGRLGVGRASVSNYLKEAAKPDLQISTLMRWSEALQVSPQWLLGTEDGSPTAKAPTVDELRSLLTLAGSIGLDEKRLALLRFALEADGPAITTVLKSAEALEGLASRTKL